MSELKNDLLILTIATTTLPILPKSSLFPCKPAYRHPVDGDPYLAEFGIVIIVYICLCYYNFSAAHFLKKEYRYDCQRTDKDKTSSDKLSI